MTPPTIGLANPRCDFRVRLQRRATQNPFAHFLFAAFFALVFASPAFAWWNSEWTFRKKITIDTSSNGAAINEQMGAVPLLVRLHDGVFRFTDAKSDGSDLRFVSDDDKTLLTYHIEKFDPLLNEAFVWVKIPELKPSAKTTVWLYYGNGGNKAVKVEDRKGTYDDETILVFHFAEHGQPASDFSGAGNNAQNPGLTSEGSMIASGLRLDGKTAVAIPASSSLAWLDRANLTWTAWLRPGPPQSNAAIFSRQDGRNSFVIGLDNGVPFAEISGPSGTQRTQPGAPLQANTWRHFALVADGLKITLYVDGEVYSTASMSLSAVSGPAAIGQGYSGNPGYTGEIDEIVIAKVARSAGAIKVAALEQGDKASKCFILGDDEQQTSWMSAFKGGYVGVIIGSLSVDGWIVIGILFVMLIVSWTVMAKKGKYLNRVGKGNEQFLREWGQVATDLSVLDAGDIEDARTMGGRVDAAAHRLMRDAPLYKIYHIGVQEIRHRLGADQSGNAKVLSARTIHAIRASLDGGLVRETQKLNNGMVLLTIAISGGPFLGLLGTVVGVMITFAAVAQAGDVNVNAIAPGIAAALAATVAGLAVAIPALFGYNYLLTRIKSITTDMHVFIDEFTTKMAEFYSDSMVS